MRAACTYLPANRELHCLRGTPKTGEELALTRATTISPARLLELSDPLAEFAESQDTNS